MYLDSAFSNCKLFFGNRRIAIAIASGGLAIGDCELIAITPLLSQSQSQSEGLFRNRACNHPLLSQSQSQSEGHNVVFYFPPPPVGGVTFRLTF